MNFNGIFDKNKYQELIKYLDTLKDIKYREFQKKIVVYDDVIGVKTDNLKKIAKEISKNDYKGFIENNNNLTYELVLIEGFIYGYLKIFNYIHRNNQDNFIDYVKNIDYNQKIKQLLEVDMKEMKLSQKFPQEFIKKLHVEENIPISKICRYFNISRYEVYKIIK